MTKPRRAPLRRAALLAAAVGGLLPGCSGGPAPSHGRAAAPELELQTLDGRTVRLSAYRGKVVLLHFWATWCPPCLEAMPHDVALQERYGPDGFVVLGMNLDRDPEEARRYLAEHPVNYPVLRADRDTLAAFGGTGAIPYTVLVDRDGYVRKRKLGTGEEIRLALERKIGFLLGLESPT